MKLYIVGSVASGKSTLARRISMKTGIPCHHLDEIVYVEDPTDSWGDRKRTIDERDALFAGILAEPHYIMEDAGRDCFIDGMRQADMIVLLEIPLRVRRRRILFRWIKQNLGIEKCIYKPQWAVLKSMFKWAKNYDKGIDGTKARVSLFSDKTIVLHNNREINAYLKKLQRSAPVGKGLYELKDVNCMTIVKETGKGAAVAAVHSDEIILSDVQSALDLMSTVQYETGCERIAINKEAVDQAFFKLSTRLAGDILQKFINYHMKLAIYGDYSGYTSKPLKDFIYESNNGRDIFFAADREEAVRRLAEAV